jgi:hypothetical protein
MHAAKISNSKRLQRVAKLLRTGKIYSTWNIMQRAKVCAVSAVVSELRVGGMEIDCWRKGGIWLYRATKT